MDRKKIYQMFILGTGELDKPLLEGLGGVILFSKDITSQENLINLIWTDYPKPWQPQQRAC